jgi:hypothetical protein
LLIHTFSLTQIEIPDKKTMREFKKVELPPYEMNRNDLFTAYKNQGDERLFCYEKNKWYAGLHRIHESLHDVKYGRQTGCPPYMKDSPPEMPFAEMLKRNGWKPANNLYDKAYCHVTVEVETIDDLPLTLQSRLAHADGDDDPQVAHSLHHIDSVLDGKRTRFISGWESHSFATITESREYNQHILQPISSWLYLLYYIHYLHHEGEIPSEQMMPRLLGNLWASTSKDISYNSRLIQVQKIVV